MFDVLLKELAKRLNLGDKANGLLSMLLSLMFDDKRGGFAGFIDRFREKGLGDAVTSWLGNSENKVLSHSQLESVLGGSVIQQMATRLDLAPNSVTTALSHLLPSVIDKLSPDGRLPVGSMIPDSAKSYLGPFADFSKTAVLPEVVAKQAAAHTIAHGHAAAAPTSGASKAWLLLIPVLLAPLFFIHQCSKEVPKPVPTPAIDLPIVVPNEPAPTPVPEPTAMHQDGLEGAISSSASDSAPASDASVALSSLAQADSFSNDALVGALNLMIVHFDSGKSTIKSDSLAILQSAAAAIKKAAPETKLLIAGHTDNRGNTESNQILSTDRANAVMAKLIELGVTPSMLSAQGFGDNQPVADNESKEGRAKNRRIAFSVVQ
jgi:outer membrane protein OmpA-like peptidoglycan-associated protein/uncharacterized protein YidB (DUF937 family)